MDRSTVTTLVKAMGGGIDHREKDLTIYHLPTEAAAIKLKDSIPFLAMWTAEIGGKQYVNVWFSQLR